MDDKRSGAEKICQVFKKISSPKAIAKPRNAYCSHSSFLAVSPLGVRSFTHLFPQTVTPMVSDKLPQAQNHEQ
jgi:hypothetical protein